MRKLSLFLMLTGLLNVHVQEEPARKKFDIRFGAGWSLLGTGDLGAANFENEFNFKFSRYFTTSASFVYGRVANDSPVVWTSYPTNGEPYSGVQHWYTSASFLQGNINIFISPFRNNRKNDLRIGGGISVYNIAEAYTQSYISMCEEWVPFYGEYIIGWEYDKRTSFGWNIIIEDTYTIAGKFLVGVKAFTQPYMNGDINSGFIGKIGMVF